MLQIDEVYSIAGVGTVAGGTVRSGSVKEGDGLLLGPADDGRFFPVTVGSIHRNRLPCRVAMAGQAACVAIGKTDPCPVRKVKLHFYEEYNMISEVSIVHRREHAFSALSLPVL